jgi:dephospho-CoA kinase
MAERTRTFGLTGGIGSGKSTVGAMFAELGAAVIDADAIARGVVRRGEPAYQDIVAAFGNQVVTESGDIDRRRLGELVFADPAARKRLEQITHPRIAAEAVRQVATAAAAGHAVVIYEASLLVENQLHRGFDGLVVVAAPRETQIERACVRDRVAPEEIERRIAAQLPLADKVAVADYVIDNHGDRADTRRQVEAVWRDILAGGPRRRT